jgi:UDP-glucose 4-epimerase
VDSNAAHPILKPAARSFPTELAAAVSGSGDDAQVRIPRMNRCLVTGGAGFIGSNIARLLVERGHEVTVFDNLSSGHRQNITESPGLRFIEGDVRDAAALEQAVAGIDTIFHLAASVGNARSIAHPIDDSEINVLGTLRVLEAARRHHVRKVVYSSSAGIFGELKTLPIGEDHAVEPDTPYGASKLAGEKLCLAYGKLYDVACVCLRYFNVYGVHQRYDAYGNVIPIFVHLALRGQQLTVYGDGEQTRDFVNVRDVAEANYRAARCSGVRGAFNIASGTQVTINRLVQLISEEFGAALDVKYGEPRPGDVRHSIANIEAARTAFGYTPCVDLRDGLREYLRWARQEVA